MPPPLSADLFLVCYETSFKSLTKEKRYDMIDAFNLTSNASDTESAFLDLNLSIHNDTASTKIYDKRDFDFDTLNFPFLDGPRRPSHLWGIIISTYSLCQSIFVCY